MKSFFKTIAIIFLLFFTQSIFAWGVAGHRIVAQIAYNNLTPSAKHEVDMLTQVMFHARDPEKRLLTAAIWPDLIKLDGVTAFDQWHYVNFHKMNGVLQPTNSQNVIWAIQQSYKAIESPKVRPKEKAMFLSFLIHFVGDIHQPLHVYDRNDRGGNDYFIQSAAGNNLHAYWDNGAGLLNFSGRMSYRATKNMAQAVEQNYPRSKFTKELLTTDIQRWALGSYQIGDTLAYTTPKNREPSASYTRAAQGLVNEQLALAGYRLANLLNAAFAQSE